MGFFSKLFGGKSKGANSEVEALVQKTLEGIIEKAQFELTFEVSTEKEEDGGRCFGRRFREILRKVSDGTGAPAVRASSPVGLSLL